jgi:hypothetical protein
MTKNKYVSLHINHHASAGAGSVGTNDAGDLLMR